MGSLDRVDLVSSHATSDELYKSSQTFGHLEIFSKSSSESELSCSTKCPATLSWSHISCHAPKFKSGFLGRNARTGEYSTILNDLSGVAAPGNLIALMGASGAGKTTLLNILTCRSRTLGDLRISGEVRVNGVELGAEIKQVSAYITQMENFSGNLTVREHLLYNATLRMGSDFTKEEQLCRVNNMIKKMGLTNCENNRILAVKGGQSISGSEQKLLAIASELLVDQPIVFCDEPTTGLDVTMALTVIRTLRELVVKENKTILCTIHQPSSDAFELFNQMILLSEGRLIFQGDLSDGLDHFSSVLNLPCPLNYNPADHYIHSLAIRPGLEQICRQTINDAEKHYRSSKLCRKLLNKVDQYHSFNSNPNVSDSKQSFEKHQFRYKSSFFTQMRTVAWKQFIDQYRNPKLFAIFILQSFVTAVMLSAMYFNQTYNQKGVNNLTNGMYLYVTQMVNLAIAQISTYIKELNVYYREYEKGMYSTSAFFLAKNLSDLPIFFAIITLTVVLFYWASNLQREFFHFLFALTVYGLLYHNSLSLMVYVIGSIFGNVTMTLTLAPTIRQVMSQLSGFWANDATITFVFLTYMQYISFNWYGFRLLMNNQWAGISNIECEKPSGYCYKTGSDVIHFYNFHDTNMTIDFLILVALSIGLRLLGWFILLVKARNSKKLTKR